MDMCMDMCMNMQVDVVAASGGYMVACVADRIVAAPFAFVGSVGVPSPNHALNAMCDAPRKCAFSTLQRAPKAHFGLLFIVYCYFLLRVLSRPLRDLLE